VVGRGKLHQCQQQFAALLAGPGQGGGLSSLAELDMFSDADQISDDESEALEAESRDARALDRRLASDLRRGQLEGPTSGGSGNVCRVDEGA
jgi:hypothetical protein